MNVYLEILDSKYDISGEGLFSAASLFKNIKKAIGAAIAAMIKMLKTAVNRIASVFKKSASPRNTSNTIPPKSQAADVKIESEQPRVTVHTPQERSEEDPRIIELTAKIEVLERTKAKLEESEKKHAADMEKLKGVMEKLRKDRNDAIADDIRGIREKNDILSKQLAQARNQQRETDQELANTKKQLADEKRSYVEELNGYQNTYDLGLKKLKENRIKLKRAENKITDLMNDLNSLKEETARAKADQEWKEKERRQEEEERVSKRVRALYAAHQDQQISPADLKSVMDYMLKGSQMTAQLIQKLNEHIAKVMKEKTLTSKDAAERYKEDNRKLQRLHVDIENHVRLVGNRDASKIVSKLMRTQYRDYSEDR